MGKKRLDATRFDAYFNAAEVEYKLPHGLLSAIAKTESDYDPEAVSPVGAIGLMQFMPATAEDMGIDPRDPIQSIFGAGKYLAWLFDRTGNWQETLAAYNWGIGNVERKGLSKMPKETVNYIQKVSYRAGLIA